MPQPDDLPQSLAGADRSGPLDRLSPWVWICAAANLLVHLLAAGRYGYFRDELYFLACARHPALGTVDHPPLIDWVTWLVVHTLGDSLWALRLVPAIAMAVVVVLCGWLARALGGGRFAQALAALVAALTPAFLAIGSILTMNALDILWWTLAVVVLVKLIERATRLRWLLLGLIFGLGGLTKLNIAFLAGALACGVLLTPQRRWLRTAGAWAAAVLALVVMTPYLAWEQNAGWPTLEFMRTIRAEKNYPVNPVEFIGMQFAVVHPMIFPIWVAGLAWLLRSQAARPWRVFGWMYAVLFVGFCALQAKFYYLFPAYPILFAAGGVAIERWTAEARRRRWRAITVGLVTVTVLPFVPLAVPILPFDVFLRYNALLDIQRHLRFERGRDRQLPIVYSDMLGWPELAEAVGRVYAELPASERAETVVLAANYGQAAALDHFGSQYGLPPARSPHNGYHLWGGGQGNWGTVIAVGFSQSELAAWFAAVEPAGVVETMHAREQVISIFVCRGLMPAPATWWDSIRLYR